MESNQSDMHLCNSAGNRTFRQLTLWPIKWWPDGGTGAVKLSKPERPGQ